MSENNKRNGFYRKFKPCPPEHKEVLRQRYREPLTDPPVKWTLEDNFYKDGGLFIAERVGGADAKVIKELK